MVHGNTPPYQPVEKSLSSRPFKKLAGKAQKKFKAEAYLRIREGLNFLPQRSRRGIFNGLLYISCGYIYHICMQTNRGEDSRELSIPGMGCMVLSTFFFSIGALCIRLAGRNIPVMEIVFMRAFIGTLFAYFMLRKGNVPLLGMKRKLLIARGGLGALAMFCFMYSYVHLPLADAQVLSLTHPVFVILFSAVLLREAIKRSTVFSIVLSMIGVVLIAKPGFLFRSSAQLDITAILITLSGAMLMGIVIIIIRTLGKTEHPFVVVLYLTVIALPFSLILGWKDFVMPSGLDFLYLLGVGFFVTLGQYFMNRGLALISAGKASGMNYLQLVFVALWGILFLGEYPDPWGLAGWFLIIFSTLSISGLSLPGGLGSPWVFLTRKRP